MSAIKYDLQLDQGTDFTEIFTIQVLSNPSLPYDSITNQYLPVDLTNYTAALKVDTSYCNGVNLLTLTSGNGITLGGTLGTVSIDITGSNTSLMPTECGECTTYYYQLELYSGGITTRPVQGKFIINKEL